MEYILEINEEHQLTLPDTVVESLNLQPGAHFTARLDAGKFVIEYVPFSSMHQGELLDQAIDSLHK
ncbi:MAG TPA: hypothetical protein VHY08_17955 [Bacillota bacterium]|nr:hypothetical protein [Bacillota bacterium]